jgi:hypothetical protein
MMLALLLCTNQYSPDGSAQQGRLHDRPRGRSLTPPGHLRPRLPRNQQSERRPDGSIVMLLRAALAESLSVRLLRRPPACL